MANLNYQRRLENLQKRRFDPELQRTILTESFRKAQVPEDLKYLAESMMPIDNEYNQKTITAADNARKHLEKNFILTFDRAYRYQGSVMTQTNIRTHSDIDLLTIIDRYHYLPSNVTPAYPYTGNPKKDINEMRDQIVKILKSIYDEVDDQGSKSVSIYNKNLRRKVDIVPCYWYNSESYETYNNEFYRGVYLYDFDIDERTEIDYPFAHIQQVQTKGQNTNDGLRKGIRLLKTLKVDSDSAIDLSSFQLTTIVYSVDESSLYYHRGSELRIAENISDKISQLINDPANRKELKSPNGTEKPLADDSVVKHLQMLKGDLDKLILDCRGDLKDYLTEQRFKSY
jgi:hypothetical protein